MRPIALRAANQYIAEVHRHHPPVRGYKFAVALEDDDGQLVGVAIAGRPVARGLDNGLTLEVTRLATDGTKDACSALYGAVRRAAKAMGYERLVTYILDAEPGTSLKASGWVQTGSVPARSWDTPSRRRETEVLGAKQRWEALL